MRGVAGFACWQAAAPEEEPDREKPRKAAQEATGSEEAAVEEEGAEAGKFRPEPPAAEAVQQGKVPSANPEVVQEGGRDAGEEDEAVVVEVARGDERGDGGEEEPQGFVRGGGGDC